MADIFDIIVVPEQVTIGTITVEVYGIPLGDFLKIIKRFPAVISALKREDVDPSAWFDVGADALGALIAAGFGKLGDEAAEARAARFPGGYQLMLLKPIMAQTMPEGAGPFVQELMSILGTMTTNSSTASA